MRRRGRECALQILYQMDVGRSLRAIDPGSKTVSDAIEGYWRSFEPVSASDRSFAERLVRGVCRQVAAVDASIASVSHHWRVDRMDRVDRNVLRLAAYEILYCEDIPRAASINEAIEIAKRFSGAESAAFINGVLDHLDLEESDRPNASGSSAASDTPVASVAPGPSDGSNAPNGEGGAKTSEVRGEGVAEQPGDGGALVGPRSDGGSTPTDP